MNKRLLLAFVLLVSINLGSMAQLLPDIKVEFNPANGEGFINAAQLDSRIPLSGWNARERNNRFFNKFTLVTPDGCRYEFGGLQATEYSAPYYARKNGELIPTSWKLVKITTADKRIVEFGYDTFQVMCDLKYVPQCKKVTGIPCTPQNPQIGQAGMTGYLIFPATLKTIKTPDETLEFSMLEYNFGKTLHYYCSNERIVSQLPFYTNLEVFLKRFCKLHQCKQLLFMLPDYNLSDNNHL